MTRPGWAPANPYGITRHAHWSDASASKPLRDQLSDQGLSYTDVPIPHLVGVDGTAGLVGYTSPTTGQPVTVLVVPHRYEIDSFAEDYYYLVGCGLEDAVARGEPYWIEQVYDHVRHW